MCPIRPTLPFLPLRRGCLDQLSRSGCLDDRSSPARGPCSVQVDQAILSEEERVVVIRFGHDWDPACMKVRLLRPGPRVSCVLCPSLVCVASQFAPVVLTSPCTCASASPSPPPPLPSPPPPPPPHTQQDEVLFNIQDKIKNFGTIYLVHPFRPPCDWVQDTLLGPDTSAEPMCSPLPCILMLG